MNNPQNAFYYDHQLPSTSSQHMMLPQRQVFGVPQQTIVSRDMNRVRNQDHLNFWMNSNFKNNNNVPSYSPAPSEISCGSGMSMNSIASCMSKLSINTRFTNYSYCPPPNMNGMTTSANQNIPPITREDVTMKQEMVVEMLRNKNLLKELRGENLRNFHLSLSWLIVGERMLKEAAIGAKNGGRSVLPFTLLGKEKTTELIKELFNQLFYLHYPDQQMGNYENQGNEWSDLVSRLVTNLVRIMVTYPEDLDEALRNIFRSVENNDNEVKNPIIVLKMLLRPSRAFSYRSVLAMQQLFSTLSAGANRHRRKKYIMSLLRDKELLFFLFKIVIPDNENMDVKAKMFAMELILKLLNKKQMILRKEFLRMRALFPLLDKYFHLQSDEGLIYKTTGLLNKIIPSGVFQLAEIPVNEEEGCSIYREFLTQFIEGNGFPRIAQMLSHGSPRVLVGCLKFLSQISNEHEILKHVDMTDTVISVLRLICSQEPLVVQHGMQFLYNIVNYNKNIKELITEKKGAEMVCQAISQNYTVTYDMSIDASRLRQIGLDIMSTGLCLLKKLLLENDLAGNAAEQIIYSGQASLCFIYVLSCTLDDRVREILEVMMRIHKCVPHKTKDLLLQKGDRTVAEAITCIIFAVLLNYDNSGKKPLMKDLMLKSMEFILEASKVPDVARIFAMYLGKNTEPRDMPVALFGAVQDWQCKLILLEFLECVTRDYYDDSLRNLPKTWRMHPHFDYFMDEFMKCRDPNPVGRARNLKILSSQP